MEVHHLIKVVRVFVYVLKDIQAHVVNQEILAYLIRKI